MQARAEQRFDSANGFGGGVVTNHNIYGHVARGQGPVPYSLHGSAYAQLANLAYHNLQAHPKDPSNQPILAATMEELAQAFNATNMQNFGNVGMNKNGGNGSAATNLVNVPALNGGQAPNHMYYQLPDGTMLVSKAPFQQSVGAYNLPQTQAQYMHHSNYQASNGIPNTPHGQGWNGQQQVSRGTPELAAPRRNSFSSNEENGPHTPFFGGYGQADLQSKVCIPGLSPQTWNTTPSPQVPLGRAYYPQPLAKSPTGEYTYFDLDALCMQEPAIPRPVPAIFTGEKGRGTLEKSLQNTLNTTNVYIRSLHPDTTDEMLHSYGSRFGDIVSAKSMLDQHTGLCKGFGFIMFHNFVDGENCIRGFYHWGYEAKWARKSHNEKLKTLADEGNTNLYASNLPNDMNEAEMSAIFSGYKVLSSKILRDLNGMSRGVGFARFETPQICDEIIENYNGKPVGTKGATLNIRYADTPAQKQLKIVTSERRQFKTNEYNTVVYGPASPYMQAHLQNSLPNTLQAPSSTNFASPLQARVNGVNGYWPTLSPVSPMFPQYPGVSTPFTTQIASATMNDTIPASAQSPSENTIPASNRYSSRIKIESPIAVALAKRAVGDKAVSSSPPSNMDDDKSVSKSEPSPQSRMETLSSPSKSSPSRSMKGSTQSKP